MDYSRWNRILISIAWVIFGCFGIVTFIQAELSVVFTDIDAVGNSEYVAPDYEVFLLDEGIDNQVFINMTIIKIPPEESTAYFQILGATMGEYKINTGFDYHTKMCDLANEPIIFQRLNDELKLGGCPPTLGTFGSKAYEFDLSTLPDTFPPNKYVLNVKLETNVGEFMGQFTLYFTVQ